MQLNLLNLDQKNAEFQGLYQCAPPNTRSLFDEALRRSWVYHDHALDGTVLSEEELNLGIQNAPGRDLAESLLFVEISRLYEAVAAAQEIATRPLTLDLNLIRHLHTLCSAPNDPNAGRYRKSDPPQAAYHHEISPARSISYRMRKLTDFINDDLPDMHPLRAAAHVHHQLMQAFPFERRSGRTARLLLNTMLIHDGYPPTIFPSSARSEYHDALAASPQSVLELIATSLFSTISNAINFFERHGVRSAGAFTA